MISSYPTNLMLFAEHLAQAAHFGQMYGDQDYYNRHVRRVANTTLEFEDPDHNLSAHRLYIVAILHDILEDTEVTYNTLVNLFGKEIADDVSAVTCYKQYGKNRIERQRYLYTHATTRSLYAALVKVADRYQNIMSGEKSDMYRVEHKMFTDFFYEMTKPYAAELWDEMAKALCLPLPSCTTTTTTTN
jgi:(p)ppGpp synthase/HD superfamily hydrolase